ncbi:MAG: MMPL family transporter [Flavobacteriales bacterium]
MQQDIMWNWLASRVLRNRMAILIAIGLVTMFMGYKATKVRLSYQHGGLLPRTDSAYISYEHFQKQFGSDGNVMVIGVQGERFYTPKAFTAWNVLGQDLKKIDGVDSVFSEAHMYTLLRDDSLMRFRLEPVMKEPPRTTAEMDTLMARVHALPFYRDLLYNERTKTSLMMVFVNPGKFNSEERGDMIERIQQCAARYEQDEGLKLHYSGLPYIRMEVTSLVRAEMPLFLGLALLVSAILLFLFFRSWQVVWACLAVVIIAVIWSFGFIGLLDFKISLLMSVIPPLVIVTGVPNCVFLINNYHYEFVRHGNKVKALTRMISRVGGAAFITNATKAAGFAAFMVTYSDVLKEFGLIATLGILTLFVLSLVLTPIFFSYLPSPGQRQLRHLERRWMDRMVDRIVRLVNQRRNAIYVITSAIVVVAFFGISQLRNESRIVDDLPKNHPVLADLHFFEENFHGVMPLEVLIDTHKKGGAMKDANLRRIEQLEDTLATYPEFSRPLAIVDAIKFMRQGFHGGDPADYALVESHEKAFIQPYLGNASAEQGMAKAFLDSTRQTTHLSVQMADIGTKRMDALLKKLTPQVDSIFAPADYTVTLTGTSIVFLKGSAYLVRNLAVSLFWAIVIIVALMALLFGSFRILVVSLIPNLIPLVITAGLMGFTNVPIKPSTILVFGIALGIAVDNAIYLLARYRLELKLTGQDLARSVDKAVREVGVGIIYTSVVLFFGFITFAASKFGGIRALGTLTSITLLVAMFTNLLVLPALLLSFNKRLTTRAFKKKPMLKMLNEEEDGTAPVS